MDSKKAFDIVDIKKNFACNNVTEPHTIDMFDTNTNTLVAFSCNHDPGSVCEHPPNITDCNEVHVKLSKNHSLPSKIKSLCRGPANTYNEYIYTYNHVEPEQVATSYYMDTENVSVSYHNVTKFNESSCQSADWVQNASKSLTSYMPGPGSPNLDPMGYMIYEPKQ